MNVHVAFAAYTIYLLAAQLPPAEPRSRSSPRHTSGPSADVKDSYRIEDVPESSPSGIGTSGAADEVRSSKTPWPRHVASKLGQGNALDPPTNLNEAVPPPPSDSPAAFSTTPGHVYGAKAELHQYRPTDSTTLAHVDNHAPTDAPIFSKKPENRLAIKMVQKRSVADDFLEEVVIETAVEAAKAAERRVHQGRDPATLLGRLDMKGLGQARRPQPTLAQSRSAVLALIEAYMEISRRYEQGRLMVERRETSIGQDSQDSLAENEPGKEERGPRREVQWLNATPYWTVRP